MVQLDANNHDLVQSIYVLSEKGCQERALKGNTAISFDEFLILEILWTDQV